MGSTLVARESGATATGGSAKLGKLTQVTWDEAFSVTGDMQASWQKKFFLHAHCTENAQILKVEHLSRFLLLRSQLLRDQRHH